MPNQTHYWVDRFDPVLLPLHGNFGIRYYGLAYLLAFVIGWLLLRAYYRAGKSPLSPPQIDQAIVAIVLGVLAGGRLGYMVLYDWTGWLHAPWTVFQVWDGGMASHGGFIGVTLAMIWISRKFALPFLQLGDLAVSITPPGLLLGRVANFINGELWGKVSTMPWAVIFPKSAPSGTPLNLIPPRHPSELYEAALEGAALLVYTQWRLWRTPALKTPGRLSGEFLIGYAVARIICEQFRQPDAGLILGMSRGTFYSLFVAAAGVLLVAFVNRQKPGQQSGSVNP